MVRWTGPRAGYCGCARATRPTHAGQAARHCSTSTGLVRYGSNRPWTGAFVTCRAGMTWRAQRQRRGPVRVACAAASSVAGTVPCGMTPPWLPVRLRCGHGRVGLVDPPPSGPRALSVPVRSRELPAGDGVCHGSERSLPALAFPTSRAVKACGVRRDIYGHPDRGSSAPGNPELLLSWLLCL